MTERFFASTVLFFAGTLNGVQHASDSQFIPGSERLHLSLSAPLSTFVIGGSLRINNTVIGAGGFGIVEAGTVVKLKSAFGVLTLFWSEGPSTWLDHVAGEFFGF